MIKETIHVREMKIPQYIGEFHFLGGDFVFSTTKKPNLWVRFWLKVFFGIKWVAKEL